MRVDVLSTSARLGVGASSRSADTFAVGDRLVWRAWYRVAESPGPFNAVLMFNAYCRQYFELDGKRYIPVLEPGFHQFRPQARIQSQLVVAGDGVRAAEYNVGELIDPWPQVTKRSRYPEFLRSRGWNRLALASMPGIWDLAFSLMPTDEDLVADWDTQETSAAYFVRN